MRFFAAPTEGDFLVTTLNRDLRLGNNGNTGEYAAAKMALSRLVKEGILERVGRGKYRAVKEVERVPFDFKSADVSKVIRLQWPFGLERYTWIYTRRTLWVTGEIFHKPYWYIF